MTLSALSSTAQDYLKVIWNTQEWSDTPVSTSLLAERLGVRPSTVSETLKRLAEKGLLEHTPYGKIGLTATGRDHAVAMVRRHRLIETFLVEVLDYRWDQVHDEAETLEHAISDTMLERIDAHLGHPTRDPHGDPIPSKDGQPHRPQAITLSDAPIGKTLTIARISDDDPEMLRFFAAKGLVIDAPITVSGYEPYADTRSIVINGITDSVALGATASAAIWVTKPAAQ